MVFQSQEASGVPAVENQEASSPELILTVKEVARLLGVHPNSVRRWADQGRIDFSRVGARGDRRFRPEDIARFLR